MVRSVARIDVGVNFQRNPDGSYPLDNMVSAGNRRFEVPGHFGEVVQCAGEGGDRARRRELFGIGPLCDGADVTRETRRFRRLRLTRGAFTLWAIWIIRPALRKSGH